jgi:Glycosyltransferase family 87/WD40-like Beta Propeller Repeat
MLPTFEWIFLVALLGLFVTLALLPAWRTLNTDFPNYYLAAVLRVQRNPVDRAYEWIWFQRQKDHNEISQPLVGFVPNPPLTAAPVLPLASLAALPAKRVWILLNLTFLIAALCILHRLTQLRWRHILLIAGLCFLPLRNNFMLGQYYIVILLLICLAYFAVFRGHRFTAGILLATAAWLKVFPAVFALLFLRKRDWRAASGLMVGSLALGAVSVLIFGLDTHRVWLFEVLPRAFRGDMVGPYDLQWSSFSSLWHRLFLFEPELNPAPFLSSPSGYAVAQALTSITLLFAFLFSTGDSSSEQTTAWEWAAFLAVLLLLSSMPSSYHYVVLIFTLIVGGDVMVRAGRWRAALLLGLLYVIACAPAPAAGLFVMRRLLATLGLYVVLLYNAPAIADRRTRKTLWALAGLAFVLAAALNLSTLRKREEDFPQRSQNIKLGYASFNPVATSRGVAAIEMVDKGYRAVMISDGRTIPMPASGDVLSMAATVQAPFVYFEQVDHVSHILRLASDQIGRPDAVSAYVTEGQQPAISYDGRWLAFLRDDHGRTSILLSRDGKEPETVRDTQNLSILEMSVTTEGDIVAALGGAAYPHLVLLRSSTGEAKTLEEIAGAVRYPAVSPDAGSLAFSRRESGSWHLFVRELSTGIEQRLTHGACNATSPAWEDPHTLLYATDCGRGFGLNAVARITLNN